jgi:hypothetical protein
MTRSVLSFFLLASAASFSVAACSAGEIAVGTSNQELQKKANGGSSGNGTTCSWDDVVVFGNVSGASGGSDGPTSDGNTGSPLPGDTPTSNDNVGTQSPLPGPYKVGDTFKSLDGCNDCTCTAKGIMCTVKACGGGSTPGNPGNPGPGCTEEAKICPDGSAVGRTGPNCEFAPCPGTQQGCTMDAMQCPDGSYVGRTGPNCTFVCPDPVACTADAKQCPDGSYVGRTGPNCEFAPCP